MRKFDLSPEGQGDTTDADALLGLVPGMTEEELASIIRIQEGNALSWLDTDVVKDRAKALDYYLGKPFGNEVEGRSQVVSTDVFDTVEGMMPSFVEMFTSSNQLGECEPHGLEDIEEAKQQTIAANHVIFKQNNFPLIAYTWFKDALLQKNGVVKFYYDDQKNEFRIEQYANLTEMELAKLYQSDHVEIIEVAQHELMIGPQPMPVYDCIVKVYTKRGRIKICNVAPENFLVTPRQTSVDLSECEFCEHREKKTKTDLLEMGFSEEELEDLGSDDIGMDATEEALSRTTQFAAINGDDRTDDPMRLYECADIYIMVDFDGDGVAELRHVFKAGSKILVNEQTDSVPFAVICPILLPHQYYGLSVADITMDIQLNKSVIHRQQLDSLYLANNPRVTVVESMVNIEDVLSSRPGGIIRTKGPNAVEPWAMPFVGREAFPMLEYWEGVKENRTGVTRYNQGLDADSLNKTAHGISQIMTAAMKRQELIARLFAETGVKALFRGVLHCLAKSGMKSLVVRLTNGYVNIDPRQWKNQYDVTINVALGSGTKERQLQLLGMLSAKQLEMMQTGRGYMVTEQNQYNLATKLTEAAGFRNPELFFTDPQAVPPQAKVPPPNPEMLKLQSNEKLKVADMEVTSQQKDKDMANERAIAEFQARITSETQIAVAQINATTQRAIAELNSDTQKRLKMAEAVDSSEERETKKQMEVYKVQSAKEEPVEAAKAMEGVLQEGFGQIADLLKQNLEQTQAGFQQLDESIQMLGKQMMAPRKKVKDQTGKTVGIEIEGFGVAPVQ